VPVYSQENALVSNKQKARWSPEPVTMFWRRETSLVPTRNNTPDHPACSIVSIQQKYWYEDIILTCKTFVSMASHQVIKNKFKTVTISKSS
jgi:hypothetical protein